DECGKVVVARTDDEVPRLREIHRRATENGVPDLRWLDRSGLREIEPHADGVAALHSPHTAIVDFPAVARALADEGTAAGGHGRLGTEAAGTRRSGELVRLTVGGRSDGDGAGRDRSGEDELEYDRLIVCAGLQADRVARLAGDSPGPAIVPFRGEY